MSLKPFDDLAPKAGRRRFARPHRHHHIWLGKSFGSHLDLGAALLGSHQGLSRDSIPSVADLLISLLRVLRADADNVVQRPPAPRLPVARPIPDLAQAGAYQGAR